MKKLLLMIKITLLIGAMVMIASCSGATRSKDACLDEFFSNANADDFSSMYTQIHPDNSNYNSYKTGTTFFNLYQDYVSSYIISRNGDTYIVSVTTLSTNSETFIFRREDDDLFSDGYWSILSFTNGGSTGATY